MGVPQLMTQCLERQHACSSVYNLVDIARQRNGIELLVDFYCFEHHIMECIWQALYKVSGNVFLRLLGGEYAFVNEYFTRLINALRDLQIQLVFFIDGAKGASQTSIEHRMGVWQKRHYKGLQDAEKLLQVILMFEICILMSCYT